MTIRVNVTANTEYRMTVLEAKLEIYDKVMAAVLQDYHDIQNRVKMLEIKNTKKADEIKEKQ